MSPSSSRHQGATARQHTTKRVARGKQERANGGWVWIFIVNALPTLGDGGYQEKAQPTNVRVWCLRVPAVHTQTAHAHTYIYADARAHVYRVLEGHPSVMETANYCKLGRYFYYNIRRALAVARLH